MENKVEIEIVFEDHGQDLMSMVIEYGKGIGTILEVKLKSLEHFYKGSFVNPESLVVGQQLEILNFKEQCSNFIKYPIKKVNYPNRLKPISINELNYMFVNSDKQREIIEKLIPGTFDDKRSDRENCLTFLKSVKEKGLYQELLNLLK